MQLLKGEQSVPLRSCIESDFEGIASVVLSEQMCVDFSDLFLQNDEKIKLSIEDCSENCDSNVAAKLSTAVAELNIV
jgi:hypothetical protein